MTRRNYLESDRPGLAFRLGLIWAEAIAAEPEAHRLDWTSSVLRRGGRRAPGRFRLEFTARPHWAEPDGPGGSLAIAYDLPLSILLGDQADGQVVVAFATLSGMFLAAYRSGRRGAFAFESAALLNPCEPPRFERRGGAS